MSKTAGLNRLPFVSCKGRASAARRPHLTPRTVKAVVYIHLSDAAFFLTAGLTTRAFDVHGQREKNVCRTLQERGLAPH